MRALENVFDCVGNTKIAHFLIPVKMKGGIFINLAAKIKALCVEHGTTFAELERALELGNGTVARWNVSSPSVDKVKRVADHFGISVDSLLEEGVGSN